VLSVPRLIATGMERGCANEAPAALSLDSQRRDRVAGASPIASVTLREDAR